jgi:hypothetical protein
MKSIQNQYIDLKEGRMSQANFMRNVRMTLPQYVTNVTSFKDAVRILKNKAILNEAMGADPIEATLKLYLAKGNSYAEAIELTAAEQGMDEEVLMSQYPQDAVDTEGYEDEGDDDEFIDMIARAEEEEAGKYTKNYDFPGGLGEGDDEEEAPEDYEDPDMFDAYGMDASEGLNEKSYKVSPNAISVSSLKKGDILSGSGLEVVSISAGARTPSGKIEVTVKDPKTGNEVTKVWNKATKVTVKKDLNEYEHTYRKIDGICYKIDDEGNRTKVADHYCRYSEDLNEARKKKEAKKELHPNQIHPQELRMGIKVEMEHTDEIDKAKKIALDHLAENPFYYTALQLSGIESPSAPKVKPPKAAKKEKAAESELVDKINAMKPVKGFEKAKASSNKAKKETNSGVKGVSELTHNAQSVRGLQKFAATGGKMKTIRENQLNEGGEWTITGTLTKDEQIDLKNMIGNYELDVQETDDTLETTISHPTYNDKSLEHALKQVRGMLPKNPSFRPGVDLGKYDLKSMLEKIVREVLAEEMADGRDDMNAQNEY